MRRVGTVWMATMVAGALAACRGQVQLGGAIDGGPEDAATSSSSGGSASSGGSGTSGGSPGTCTQCGAVCVYPECGGGCAAAPPAGVLRGVSLSLTGVSIDGGSMNGWETRGFNLDGKCTDRTSTDVCTQVAGATKPEQGDGTGGIDNSYAENVCPIDESIAGAGECSSLQNVYVVTDATGNGTMAIPTNGSWLEFPIRDTFVSQTGAGGPGVLGAVAPTDGLISAYKAVSGAISPSLCADNAFQSLANIIRQASDILSTGGNASGVPCDSISIGMTFTGSTPYGGPLPAVSNPCASDAGSD